MITSVEGKMGSGKSYWATREIVIRLSQGFHVFTNMELKNCGIRKVLAKRFGLVYQPECYHYLTDEEILDFQAHISLSRGRRLLKSVFVVIDETQNIFNSRNWKNTSQGLRNFLPQSDKAGVDIWFLSQSSGQVEKMFRDQAENYFHCRDLSKVGIPGLGRLGFYKRLLIVEKDSTGKLTFEKRVLKYEDWVFTCYETSSFLDAGTKALVKNLGSVDRVKLEKVGAKDKKVAKEEKGISPLGALWRLVFK